MKRKAPDSREGACVLCRRADSNPDVYGEKRWKDGVCAHENCLYLASRLPVRHANEMGADEFLPADIRRAVKRASRKLCYVCGERGATVTCRQKGCKRSFHFPCGREDGCVSQFSGQYRSFCREHRPEQSVQAQQDGETSCLICLEPVEEKLSYHTMVCPACLRACFHRGCIQVGGPSCAPSAWQVPAGSSVPLTLVVTLLQQQALRAGLFSFQCPQCKDSEKFLLEMSSMGIRVPLRQPAWEADGAFAELYQRHNRCDASRCLCAGGREQAEEAGPWHLLLCSSCAARGTHRRCSTLRATAATWECDDCVGLGTGEMEKVGRGKVLQDWFLNKRHNVKIEDDLPENNYKMIQLLIARKRMKLDRCKSLEHRMMEQNEGNSKQEDDQQLL
ncbi:PHD finger protein 7-like [Apteryx mantelli]|uniref:PHD finger protein 7-like n=1 Tax=Apteryx mantelli TaxID=2696672 RepID=A0ABM4DZ98_9AVES